MNTPKNHRPWWREPMMWLVLGAPAVSVVGGIALLVVALQRPDPVLATEPGMTPALKARNHAATPAQARP